METDIKPTVALVSRSMPPLATVRQPGSAADAASAVGNPQQNSAIITLREEPAEGAVRQAGKADSANLQEAVRNLNDYVQNVRRNLQFDLDDESGHTIVRVLDADTDEVIRQMPSEEVLALARHMRRMSEQQQEQGLFLQEKV